MGKNEIEKRLNKVISNLVPNVLDNILEKCEEKKGAVNTMEITKKEEKTRKRFSPKLIGALAIAVICICGIMGYNQYDNYYKIDTTIEFDVNPSIELQVNKKERIIDVIALNEDGKKIIEGMDLRDTDLDVATNALVGSMLKNGYISESANSILVSVKNDNTEKSKKLQEEISTNINELLKASSVEGSILTQEYNNDEKIKKLATDNSVSEGKAKLINNILNKKLTDNNGNAYTFEGLSKMSINELNVLLEAKNTKIEQVKTTGTTASKTSYIGQEKAKSLAYSNANVSKNNVSNVTVEIDYDDGRMVYDVEFYVAKTKTEYSYEIDAKTGKILEKDVDKNETPDRDDDSKKTTSTNTKKKTTNNTKKTTTTTTTKKSTNNKKKTTTSTSTYIGTSKAKQIAFKNAGISASSASKVKVETDNDDGRRVYEVEFYVAKTKTEYNYEIDAKTGKILDKDIDRDDD